MRGIRILNPGFSSAIQDDGRFGYREFGMPTAGAMDKSSLFIANWLVRNSINEAAIETIFYGLEFEFLSPGIFAITGGDMLPEKNGKPIPMWRSLKANKGDIVRLSGVKSGARAYISFNGGFRIEPELSSLSTYAPGKVGGFDGRLFKKGDIIPLYPSLPMIFNSRIAEKSIIPEFETHFNIRVVKGVDFNSFPASEATRFSETEYIVSSQSDRMGIRLNSDTALVPEIEQVVSYGVQPGTIQVPPEGNPIIMGSDCQTVGGYPQIANIISADLSLIGQLKPDDTISFNYIELSDAVKELKEQNKFWKKLFGTSSASVCTDCIEKRR